MPQEWNGICTNYAYMGRQGGSYLITNRSCQVSTVSSLAWPVIYNASSYSDQMQVPTDLAYDTEGMFLPDNCLDRDPSICKTGLVFTKEGLTCPKGIFTNIHALINMSGYDQPFSDYVSCVFMCL